MVGIFLLGLCLILGGAVLGARHPDNHDAIAKSASITLESVGGAVLAAVVVGFLVDNKTRHKLSRETGERWLWALLGEDTPPMLKERAKEIISHGQAHLSVDVRCSLDWVPNGDNQALRLRVRVLTDGVNHSRSDSYIPDGPAWAMPSISGKQTRYLKWAFEVSDKAGARALRRLEAMGGMLAKHSHETPPDQDDFKVDGSVFLYQPDLIKEIADAQGLTPERRAAAPGERFRLERELELFLDPTDFFPFFILVPTVGLKVEFTGDACSDLAIKARNAGTQVMQRPDASEPKEFAPNAALLPGHVVIFSWHPREGADSIPKEIAVLDKQDDADPQAGAATAV
jgi:hypothetical protein